MKSTRIQTSLFLIFLLLISCEKLIFDKEPENRPTDIFDVYWINLDEKYSYFTLKNINWDSMYTVTKPLVYDEMHPDELWSVLSGMLCVLDDDGHVGLYGDGKMTRWDACNTKTFNRNFDYNLIVSNYLSQSLKYSGPLLYDKIGSIGYVYYSSFTETISDSDIDFLIDYFKDTEGLIIDIRDNMGGSDQNANLIESRLLSTKTWVENIYYKNGPGHNDFASPQKLYISPEGSVQYTKPIAVLMNRYCYSASSNFASRMSVLPHVSLIGDSTLGGAGRPKYFDLPNGWIVRYSSNYAFRPDGYDYEGGVPPDYFVEMEDADKANGEDTIIEYAISWINSH